MKDEYIIINKTAIQERIKWLEQRELNKWQQDELRNLRLLLSQSTPLIPEIENAFNTGFHKGYNVGQNDAQSHPLALTIANHIHNDRQNYISNLKLDI